MRREGAPDKVRAWTNQLPEWVEVRAAASPDPGLTPGADEREAIAMAEELRADLPLMDDAKRWRLRGGLLLLFGMADAQAYRPRPLKTLTLTSCQRPSRLSKLRV